jgi:hypothetical protein
VTCWGSWPMPLSLSNQSMQGAMVDYTLLTSTCLSFVPWIAPFSEIGPSIIDAREVGQESQDE